MAKVEYIKTDRVPELDEDGNVKVSTDAVEIYTEDNFHDMVSEKKRRLNERDSQIQSLKKKIEFIDSIEETEELVQFKEMLSKAKALEEKDNVRRDLRILEMDYANLEREVLAYDNWSKKRSQSD